LDSESSAGVEIARGLMGESSGGPANVNVRARGSPWNRSTESDEGDASFAQVLGQRFAFDAVGVKGDVHRIMMIET